MLRLELPDALKEKPKSKSPPSVRSPEEGRQMTIPASASSIRPSSTGEAQASGASASWLDIVNLEVWDISRPMARQVLPAPTGVPSCPTCRMELARVRHARGVLALPRALREAAHRPTVAINARVCIDYPRVAPGVQGRRLEFMGHSFEQGPIHNEKDSRR